MVDQSAADDGDGFEAAVWMMREAGHFGAVVHPPSVDRIEVVPDLAALQRRGIRPEAAVTGRIEVDVVDAEQERIDRRPLESQRNLLQHGVVHPAKFTGYTNEAITSPSCRRDRTSKAPRQYAR